MPFGKNKFAEATKLHEEDANASESISGSDHIVACPV